MNWPAPELLPPPSTQPCNSADNLSAGSATRPPGEAAGHRPSNGDLPAATWIALLGGVLILVAAGSIVVSTWDTIGRSIRVAGLAVGTTVLLMLSERLRRAVPVTSNIVAHVGTFLVGSVGIAMMSLFGFTWPSCLLVGGLAALGASVLQSDRWKPEMFRASEVASIAIASTGLAALTGIPGAMVAIVAALGLAAAGADRRAAALAIGALLSPMLVVLADLGLGAGTLLRAGLVGEQLAWSGPVVGVLAAIVLAFVGHRRDSAGLLVTAAVAPVIGAATGLAALDRGDITTGDAWMLIITTTALAVGAVMRRRSNLSSWVAYSPGLVVGALWLLTVQIERETAWAFPAALAFGVTSASIGAWRRLAAPLVAGIAITVATTFVATGSELTAIPTWAWLAVGGAVLLAIAVAVERTGKCDAAIKDAVSRWD